MKILFVCEGNIYRSQMAGTMFKSLMPSAEVETAGVLAERAGQRLADVSPQGIAVMKESGFDMSSNVITRLTPAMVEVADKVVLMGPTPGGPLPDFLQNSPKLEKWNVPDPGYELTTVESARDMVLEKVKQLAFAI